MKWARHQREEIALSGKNGGASLIRSIDRIGPSHGRKPAVAHGDDLTSVDPTCKIDSIRHFGAR